MFFYTDERKIRDYKPGLVLIDFEGDPTELQEYANAKDFSGAILDAYMLKDGEIFDLRTHRTPSYEKTIFTQNGFCEIRRKENSYLMWGYFDPEENMSYDLNKMRIIKLEEGMIYYITPTHIRVYKCAEEEEEMHPRLTGLNAYLTIRDEWFRSYEKPVLSDRKIPEIERVIFNYPATIVIWKDNTKTVVKCSENDQYDEETGLALCIAKKALGNKGNWYNEFKKWLHEPINLNSKDILAEITKAARKAQLKKIDYDRINDVVEMIEFNSKSPLRLPVMLTPDAAETVKDVLKQVMASIR